MYNTAELTSLIVVLKEYISAIDSQLNNIKEFNSSKINTEQGLIDSLSADITGISGINDIEEIFRELGIDNETIEHLKLIIKIVNINKAYQSTLNIPDDLKKSFNSFIKKWKDVLNSKRSQLRNDDIPNLEERKTAYEAIIKKIDNKELITASDIEIIKGLLGTNQLSTDTKRDILLGIIAYNHKVYNNQYELQPRRSLLSIDEVSKLLDQYGYKFSLLSQVLQNELLTNGSLENIEGVLESLKNNRYPKIDIVKSGDKLVLLLLRSNKETINENTKIAQEYGIQPKDILKIAISLVNPSKEEEQEEQKVRKNPPKRPPKPPTSSGYHGASKDFILNLKYLNSIGISNETINSNRAVLVISHRSLRNRIELLNKYGIDITRTKKPALSGLLSNGIDILDQFIETSPKGLEYVQNNLSALYSFSVDDPVFYRIYASYKLDDGPFSTQRGDSLSLRGEISDKSYTGPLYRNITEENKRHITGTIKVETANKDIFDECTNNRRSSKSQTIDELLYEDEELQKLAQYINPSRQYEYNFDGITVSRYKVARIYNTLKENDLHKEEDALLYAVTYNLIINQEDFDKLKSIIKGWRK